MYATLIAAAALWGAVTGLLVPRPAYRLTVEPEQAWRSTCSGGHPLTGPARGWLGAARCRPCAGAPRGAHATTPDGTASASPTRGDTVPPPTRGDTVPPPTRGDTVPPPTRGDTVPPAPTRGDTAPSAPPRASAAPPKPSRRSAAPPPAVHLLPSRAVPAVTALACAGLALATGPRPELAVWLLLTPFAVLLALVDLGVHRLPDQVTLPLAGAAAGLLGVAALLPGHAGTWPSALLGGLTLGAGYFALFLVNPSGLGFGDVKLALSLGVVLGWYGWRTLLAGAFAGFLFGAVYGVGLILSGRANRRSAIPFGPFMIGGALAGVLLGAAAARA
ncbi:prepilin peptidase [Streptomyces sp. NPDC050856]|uniref:prepilin peptidase n=1 Tax=Streptomyces sp. NPDC050856 TaxID=3154939 RepID=UPI0033FD3FEC